MPEVLLLIFDMTILPRFCASFADTSDDDLKLDSALRAFR
jgi:hypothetical protein